MQGTLLTVRDVADRLGLDLSSVYRKIRSGELPAVQLGGERSPLRVDSIELERYVYGEGDERAS